MLQREIKVNKWYPYPPSLVWRALTEKEFLDEWLMKTNFKPVVGQDFEFRTQPQPGFDGIIRGKVLSVDKPNILSYSWQSGKDIATTVTFQLKAENNGTNLSLVHGGFKGISAFVTSFILQMGWKGNLLGKRLPGMLSRMVQS